MRVSPRLRAALDDAHLDDWELKVIAGSDRNSAGIGARQLDSIMEQAADAGGSHVFGVTDQRDGVSVARQIKVYFRFRWLTAANVHAISRDSTPFMNELRTVLTEESAWRARVMPTSKQSALILPQGVFRCGGEASQVWRLAERYNENVEFYSVVAEHLIRFSQQYRRRDRAVTGHHVAGWQWVDDARRVWRDDGPFHGIAPFPRDWKYSYRLPDGFHFDVGHEQRAPFSLNDCHGNAHQAKADGRLNIDAHGWKR
jgi:hypothetical protein